MGPAQHGVPRDQMKGSTEADVKEQADETLAGRNSDMLRADLVWFGFRKYHDESARLQPKV